MPRTYKALTAVLAFSGCIGIIITGQINPLILISCIVMVYGYIRFWKGMPASSKFVIGFFSISTLLFFVLDAIAISGETFLAVAHLTIIFQAIKSFDLKEPWDHLQVYFMSLLQMIIASELTRSLAFGLIFIVFLVALVAAMVISHFLKEGTAGKIRFRRPVVIISILTLVITTAFFISAPRVKGGLWGKSRTKNIKTVGFSEKVDFGSFGDVKLDPTIVMRIETSPNALQPFYWRGMTLNYFDGISWADTIKKRARIHRDGSIFTIEPVLQGNVLIQRIFLEPLNSDVVFGLGKIVKVDVESRMMFVDHAGAVFTSDKSARRLNYTVYSTTEEQAADENLHDYLQFPWELKKLSELAVSISKGATTDIQKASGIENYLKANYRYSLETAAPGPGVNPIEGFLFNSKQGYCEHYATAMTLMLRAIGIPSRIVTGFLEGERNKYGGYIIVRQSSAHSWVEAAINGRWKRFDPTPSYTLPEMPSAFSLYMDSLRMKWYRYVVNFSSYDQRRLIEYIALPFVKIPGIPEYRLNPVKITAISIVIVFAVSLIIILLKYVQIYRHGFIISSYIKFRHSLKHKGANITASSTPSDVVREALRAGLAAEVSEFISLYEKARFSGKKLTANELRRYKTIGKSFSRGNASRHS